MRAIIWHHVKQCVADLHAYRLDDNLDVYSKPGGQVFVGDKRREWRMR